MGNNETHVAEQAAWERGYREAVLDVFCFLTDNPQVLDIGAEHFSLLQALAVQVSDRNQLREIEEAVEHVS